MPLAKGLKALGQPTLGAISRRGTTEETITSEKNLGSPGTDDPKCLFVKLGALCKYYSQPGSLKLPTRVCQGAVVNGGGNGGVGVGRGSPLTS
jgi:hypothetical protein